MCFFANKVSYPRGADSVGFLVLAWRSNRRVKSARGGVRG